MLISETQQGYDYNDLSNLHHGVNRKMIQLGPFQRKSWVNSYKTPHVAYFRYQYGVAYDHHVHTKKGYVSFGVLEPGNPDTWTYQSFIPNDAIMVFSQDETVKASLPAGFIGNTLHFSEEFMMNLAEHIYCQPLKSLLPATGMHIPNRAKLNNLRAEMSKWRHLEAYGAETRPAILSRREESLALAVIDALVDEGNENAESPINDGQCINRALEFIHDSELENISAVELCQRAQCSQRTLEKHFLKRFGVTPKKYVKCLRLGEVHDGLQNFDKQGCDSIIELAGIHGFWHMGQFAADYRRIYGKLPSDTLNRR